MGHIFVKKLIAIVFLIFLLPSCKKSLISEKLARQKIEKVETLSNHEAPINIFIHGTLPPVAAAFVNKYDAPLGLHKGKSLKNAAFLRRIGYVLHEADPENFNIEHFYLFGWSGILSFNARKKAAQELYSVLKGAKGPITLIGHSHGGNVALYLAEVAKENGDDKLLIDKAILLASPIQEVTTPYATCGFFKKVISIYSNTDMIQILDPQGLYAETQNVVKNTKPPLFSKRHLPKGDNIIQARILLNKSNPAHIDFTRPKFLKNLPSIISLLEQKLDCYPNKEEHAIINLPNGNKPNPSFVIQRNKVGGSKKYVPLKI